MSPITGVVVLSQTGTSRSSHGPPDGSFGALQSSHSGSTPGSSPGPGAGDAM